MPRASFNVLVLPFRKKGIYEFAVFKRADLHIWQFVSGGGEDDEKPEMTAVRETNEEAGIPVGAPYYLLDSHFTVTADNFPAARKTWPKNTYVITNHCFAVNSGNMKIVISAEHTEYIWAPYDECMNLLHFKSNQSALWELNERLVNNDLVRMNI